MKKIKKNISPSTVSTSETEQPQLVSSEWNPLLILLFMLSVAFFLPFLFSAAPALIRRWNTDSVNAGELSNPCDETFQITHFYGNSSAPVAVFGEWHTEKEARNVISCLNKLHPNPNKLSILLEGPSPEAGKQFRCSKLRREYSRLDSMNVECFSIEGPPTSDDMKRAKLNLQIALSGLDLDDQEKSHTTKQKEEINTRRYARIDQGLINGIEMLRRQNPTRPIVAVVGINHANPNHSPRFFKTKGVTVFSTKTPDPQLHMTKLTSRP